MKKNEVKKNLYDLDYNTSLSYLSISLIILATLLIAFLFNFSFEPIADLFGLGYEYDPLAELIFKLLGIFIAIFIGIAVMVSFNQKLKGIKNNIQKLEKI